MKRLTKAQKEIVKQREAFDAQVERSMAMVSASSQPNMSMALLGIKNVPMRATYDPSGWFVFSNGQFGTHRISFISDADRVLAHWTGYLENNERFGPKR